MPKKLFLIADRSMEQASPDDETVVTVEHINIWFLVFASFIAYCAAAGGVWLLWLVFDALQLNKLF